MASTFSGLEIAKRGLDAHKQAIHVTGHNISNADNKHYSRQRVDFSASQPIYMPAFNREQRAGMVGQGVDIASIIQIRDSFIDQKLNDNTQQKHYFSIQEKYMSNIEIIINEPADEAIRKQLDKFWQSWQELSQHPEKSAHREVLLASAESLTYGIRDSFAKLYDLRTQADIEVQLKIEQVNNISKQIANLNNKIFQSEVLGDNPNDLRDKRNMLVQELSKMADVSIKSKTQKEFLLYIGGEVLVQGSNYRELETKANGAKEGLHDIYWKDTQKEVVFKRAEIQSLLEIRDITLKEQINNINALAVNLSDIVNEVHKDGFGLNNTTNQNFFTIESLARDVSGNYDLDQDGISETTALFRVTGANEIAKNRSIGIEGVMTFARNDAENTPIYINYRADDTVNSVIDKINQSDAGVVAYLNHKNNLVIKSNSSSEAWQSNFMIRHLEDSGEFLVGFSGVLQNSGSEGAYDYQRTNEVTKLQVSGEKIELTPNFHPAGRIFVNEVIQKNIDNIAARTGRDAIGTSDNNLSYGEKDGQNALYIAQAIKHNGNMIGNFTNIDSFYNAMVSRIGSKSQHAKEQLANLETIAVNLENNRQSIMGVNLDEEMSNLVQFQNSYNASAKVIQTVNEMIEHLIERLG